MAKDPAFLFYPGDYLRDTQCLSPTSQVAYDRIMCEHMRNICITQQQLNFFTKRLSNEEKEELQFCLSKVDGGFQIEWVAESIAKRREYSESRRNNRSGKKKKISNTYVKHMEIENEIENTIENEELNKEWQNWKKYKKKIHKFEYASSESEARAIKQLLTLSSGNEKRASAIIRQSIDNNWKGFFPIKETKKNVVF